MCTIKKIIIRTCVSLMGDITPIFPLVSVDSVSESHLAGHPVQTLQLAASKSQKVLGCFAAFP